MCEHQTAHSQGVKTLHKICFSQSEGVKALIQPIRIDSKPWANEQQASISVTANKVMGTHYITSKCAKIISDRFMLPTESHPYTNLLQEFTHYQHVFVKNAG